MTDALVTDMVSTPADQFNEQFGVRSFGFVPLQAASSIPSNAAFTNPIRVEDGDNEHSSTQLRLTFTAYNVQPSEGTIAGDLKIIMPVPLKEEIKPQLSDIVGCKDGTSGQSHHPVFKAKYQDYQDANLAISIVDETGRSSKKIPIPLNDFLASSVSRGSDTCEEKIDDITNRLNKLHVPINLPILSGSAQKYPSDESQCSMDFRIKMPKGFSLAQHTTSDASSSVSLPATLPDEVYVRSTRGTEGKTVFVLGPDASLPSPRSLDKSRIAAINASSVTNNAAGTVVNPPANSVDLRLLIVRDWRTQLFVYIVSLLPLALILILIPISLTELAGENFIGTTLTFAVTMLAVLPLRAVLVPPDVQGLTHVDYILGIQLIGIVVVALGLTSWHLWKSTFSDGF